MTQQSQPHVPPLVRSTIFEFQRCEDLAAAFRSRADGVYTRFGNPTNARAAAALAELEGAEAGLLFASGMAAISTTLLAFLRAGSHVVCQRDVFAQTFGFLEMLAACFGVRVSFVDATEPRELEAALTPDTALIYVETPSNPLLKVVDLAAVGRTAGVAGVPMVVDSTFATPVLQRPLRFGASLVVHSTSKYIGGHADVLGGAVLGRADHVRRVREYQRLLGGIADPAASALILRSLGTLELRVTRQASTAQRLAEELTRLPGVDRVHYPFAVEPSRRGGDADAIARRQMTGGGGMVSFEVAGGAAGARAVLDRLEVIRIATSLGGVHSVAEIPGDLDFDPEEARRQAGVVDIGPSLVRLSVGLEEPELLLEDLRRGLGAARLAAC